MSSLCRNWWQAATLVLLISVGLYSGPSRAGAADGPSEYSSGGFCTGLLWKIPNLFEKESSDSKCAATAYIGVQNNTSQLNMFGLAAFAPAYEYKFVDSYFLGGSLSRVLSEIGEFIAFEFEVGLGKRFGDLHQAEIWTALYVRWKYFPWHNYLRTSIAVSTGLSYASGVPRYEVQESGNQKGQRLLHYLSPEITFALPKNPGQELVIRSHHRSGGGICDCSLPLYGNIFHRVEGGVQYLNVGFRQHF